MEIEEKAPEELRMKDFTPVYGLVSYLFRNGDVGDGNLYSEFRDLSDPAWGRSLGLAVYNIGLEATVIGFVIGVGELIR